MFEKLYILSLVNSFYEMKMYFILNDTTLSISKSNKRETCVQK